MEMKEKGGEKKAEEKNPNQINKESEQSRPELVFILQHHYSSYMPRVSTLKKKKIKLYI